MIRPGGLKLVLGRDKRTAIDAKPRFDSLAYFISPSLLLADILIESSSLQVPAVSFFIALPSLVLDPPEYRYQNTPLQACTESMAYLHVFVSVLQSYHVLIYVDEAPGT